MKDCAQAGIAACISGKRAVTRLFAQDKMGEIGCTPGEEGVAGRGVLAQLVGEGSRLSSVPGGLSEAETTTGPAVRD